MKKILRMRMIVNRGLWCIFLMFLSLLSFGQASEAERFHLKTVVIDPGHGGKDTGAIGRQHKEKDIVLAIALKVRDYLKQYLPDLNVVMTREEDKFVPLDERARIANEYDADLFVSIHANSIRNARIYGAETFVLGLHRSEENLEVAKKENAVIVLEDDYKAKYEGFDPNSTESYIIFELMQNVYLDQSIGFASAVQEQLKNRVGRYDRGVKQAGFLVLRETAMPGVLVEVGFISNKSEERFMASENGQVYLASAIFRAIRDYKERFDARNSNLIVSKESAINSENDLDTDEQSGQIQYRIQIASSLKPVDIKKKPFNLFNDIWEYKEGNYYKYTTGLAYSHEEIQDQLLRVKAVVPDCFIVGFRNGIRVIP